MSHPLYIRIFFKNEDGTYRDSREDFEPDDFGGCIPAVGDVIVSHLLGFSSETFETDGGFWEVVKRYFKPDPPNPNSSSPSDSHPHLGLVVRERSRLPHELGI